MQRLLEEVEFARLAGVPEPIVSRIGVLLEQLPDPDEALRRLDRFRKSAPAAFEQIAQSNTALRYLLGIFAYSRFLSDEVVRQPELILQLADSGDMHRVLSAEEYEVRLSAFLGRSLGGVPPAVELACFRRQQILRVVLRDVLGLGSLSDVTEELSNLADAILNIAYRRIRDDLAQKHGTPRADGSEAQFSVISLGKLGGQELNYSSDIDLMFIYSANGMTDGPAPITNKEFFKKVANQYTELLSTYTSEGMCYRVDLRLRPDGRYGEVCQSLEGARNYYRTRGRDWELQMLIKARISAGEPDPGRELLEFVEPLIYSTTLDFKAVEAVSETRERIHEKLNRSPQADLDIKLTRGGIRDIEFLVQCLQRLHGGKVPWLRHGGTLLALARLRDKDLLSDSEYARLVSAYQFLRNLEHRLQFDEDRQTHALPRDLEKLEVLSRKMPVAATSATQSAGSLERELDEHLSAVQELYERVIHSQRLIYYMTPEPPREVIAEVAEPARADRGEFPSPNLARFLDQRTPRLAALLTQSLPIRNSERLEHFLEKMAGTPEWLSRLEENPELAKCTLDFFEHSQFFADQLIRHPDLLEEVSQACGFRQGRTGFNAPEDAADLRRFFREQMVRIQSDSVYHRAPIFKTLKRTSDLADSVISAAYTIGLADAMRTAPPVHPGYQPLDQMMVIALGRLGMREFDLASDADLVFVLRDDDAAEVLFWTGVAERMIHVISAYTGDGVIFTVDTRLRPNGREGPLVLPEAVYKDYFAKHAEAWEGISYMKARAVAGDMEQATEFLHQLQDVDWRRYGQGGRSRKELAQMRARLEKEQGTRNPLKAGPGGYYDIDFALMYLRLKGAGIFYKVLNTPERIDIIEKMGHLEREDADFLREAATLFRAIDHGLRVATGHAEGRLPSAKSQISVLTELVRRWIPADLHGSLESQLGHIRNRTRQFFDRVFA